MRAQVTVGHPDGFTVDVDLDFTPGQTVALVGPNGAGKTTVLMAVAGLIPGHDGRGRRRVGLVFQDGVLFPNMTVRDNVEFGSTSDVGRLMVDMGIDDLADRLPNSLSGGETQRVALARALATKPDVLLLDEPLSALDATSRIEIRRFLRDQLIAFEGPSVIVTHDPVEAFGLADRVYVMEGGRVVQEGTPEEMASRPATPYVADLVGTNLVEGDAEDGVVVVGDHRLHVTDVLVSGPVLVQIHPRTVSIHRDHPSGSARNVWRSPVAHIESLGPTSRISFEQPMRLTAEVTPAAVEELGIAEDLWVWLAIKATEIQVRPR